MSVNADGESKPTPLPDRRTGQLAAWLAEIVHTLGGDTKETGWRWEHGNTIDRDRAHRAVVWLDDFEDGWYCEHS